MGMYLSENSQGVRLSHHDKVAELVADGAVVLLAPPDAVLADDGTRPFVCVVHNPTFDVAVWLYDDFELLYFARPTDPRQKSWLRYSHAERLAR